MYAELEGRKFLLQSLWPLQDMIIMTAAFHTDEDHAAIHDDYRELLIINEGIYQVAARLVTLLRRRSDNLNISDRFSVDHLCQLTDYMDHD